MTFQLTKANNYSGIIKLTQKGGLVAYYYESVNFEMLSLVADNNIYGHLAGSYTQVDKLISFDLGDRPMVLQSEQTFPSQYFSVKWVGYIRPKYTETYRLYLESYRTAQFKLTLAGKQLIYNQFEDSTSQPTSAFFASNDIDLKAEELYDIEITYAERLGQTKLRLMWESDSQVFEVVGSDSLFNTLNSSLTPFLFTVNPAATNETACHLLDTKPT